jgi:hypothetical protein
MQDLQEYNIAAHKGNKQRGRGRQPAGLQDSVDRMVEGEGSETQRKETSDATHHQTKEQNHQQARQEAYKHQQDTLQSLSSFDLR